MSTPPEAWGNRPTIWQGRGTTNSNGQVTLAVPPGSLQVTGKRGSVTFYATGSNYSTSGTAGSCVATVSLYPQYNFNNPTPPATPTLTLTSPQSLSLNQAATLTWTGGSASNTIKVDILDPITELPTTTTILSNSILVNGSVNFTPTQSRIHIFYIEATDANGDVTTAYSENSYITPT